MIREIWRCAMCGHERLLHLGNSFPTPLQFRLGGKQLPCESCDRDTYHNYEGRKEAPHD